VVTNLPEGDAMGDMVTGSYSTDLYTTDCRGDCVYELFGEPTSACDVGVTTITTVAVTQDDGYLLIETNDSNILIQRFEGGIDQDGSFDVGGYATQLGGEVEITGRSQGTITGDGDVTGTMQVHGRGEVAGDRIDCVASYDITGEI
jgi:hypothetical protein